MKKILIVFLIVAVIGLAIWLNFGVVWTHKSDFSGPVTVEDPLPDELIGEMEDYVQGIMKRNRIPGSVMVFVHGDEVVYSKGFGVRDFKTKEPITPETLFGIGSTTKPMTAIVIASLVDDGVLNWDTKVTEILPSFALSDQNSTDQITIKDTLCMCTGVPRRMEEISVRYDEMSAEEVIESLAKIQLSSPFGSKFNYSSRMVAAGGYIASLAAGGEYGDMAQAYETMFQERLLDLLEMNSSTFSIEVAVESGNYATPYYSALSGPHAISPEIEGVFTPIAPAGALWSNAEDMSKFLVMLLNDGVSAEGERIISKENISFLWEPEVAIDPSISYGLGWNIEDYHGLKVYFHPGGTVGFASELVVIPELDVGFLLLTNQLDQISPMGRMATYRFLEMLTGRDQVYDYQIGVTARDLQLQLLQLDLITRKKVDPEKIAPFLGEYHNNILGEIKLLLHDNNTLWVDFGEYESSIRPLIIEENQYIFFESVFIGKTITFSISSDGSKTIQWSGDEATYTFHD